MSELSTYVHHAWGFAVGFGITYTIGSAFISNVDPKKKKALIMTSLCYSLPLPISFRVGAAAVSLLGAIVVGTPSSCGFKKLGALMAGTALTYCIAPQNNESTPFNFVQSMVGISLGIATANILGMPFGKRIID